MHTINCNKHLKLQKSSPVFKVEGPLISLGNGQLLILLCCAQVSHDSALEKLSRLTTFTLGVCHEAVLQRGVAQRLADIYPANIYAYYKNKEF